MLIQPTLNLKYILGFLVCFLMLENEVFTNSFCPNNRLVSQHKNSSSKTHHYHYNEKRHVRSLVVAQRKSTSILKNSASDESKKSIDPNTLMDMDIIIYTIKSDETQQAYIGAIQEDMTLAPLSAWTTEPAYGNSIEFVVDEEDRWMKELEFDNIIVKLLLEEDMFSYGSRQVGGGKGLGNPHGEESEVVYYIENEILEKESIVIPIKPELEILW